MKAIPLNKTIHPLLPACIAALALIGVTPPAHAQVQGAMKIEGASSSGFYKGWIELNSVTQTVTRAAPSDPEGSLTLGTADASEIEVEKEVDRTSVPLVQACSGGASLPSVTIRLFKTAPADGDTSGVGGPYLEWHLENVRVTSYRIGGDDSASAGDLSLREAISLSYESAALEFVDGSSSTSSSGSIVAASLGSSSLTEVSSIQP